MEVVGVGIDRLATWWAGGTLEGIHRNTSHRNGRNGHGQRKATALVHISSSRMHWPEASRARTVGYWGG